MEANVCDVNHLDSDVLLPPRKRLLACLKKQNGDGNQGMYMGSGGCSDLNRLDSRISYLLKAHLSSENPTQEEIVDASRAAAEVAVKAAMAARAAAQEKAVVAAKAMAAAKKALELVVSGDDGDKGTLGSSMENMLKKNKKKHVDVQMLYNSKKPGLDNGKANDEELARKLHQAINSSPRISKTGAPAGVKSPKNKKVESANILENGCTSNGSIVIKGKTGDKEVENTTNSKMENGDAEKVQPKVKTGDEDITTIGRKRGRMKQKKLPLSICHDRDQANPKESSSRSSLSVGPSTNGVLERNSSWKCQAFKPHACVKQNKVMQS
uniref:Uncharacterized protein n=1 Tax=Tanacetum cinerariifolium TaxID=118510 RepID=A0A6L2JHM7_TANCI|nr:hypothetical protein [Tanacetum cinerariifolium]